MITDIELFAMQNDYFYIVHSVYIFYDTIHMYSGITSGRVLDGELIYTNILEVCPVNWREISMKQSVGKCKHIIF